MDDIGGDGVEEGSVVGSNGRSWSRGASVIWDWGGGEEGDEHDEECTVPGLEVVFEPCDGV